jgi:cobyrinic acid a,c-diamide synthase
MKGCIIAAPMTGSGKTTVTLGLLAALRRHGISVQPFKVGPDFIDPGLHAIAAGTSSHNLDGWMFSKQQNKKLFWSACADKAVAVVEGVMGLFDGVDGRSNSGSTAEMAEWLDLPIVLVLDAHVLARSAAALVKGFRTFDERANIAGVIFNRVAGEGHYRILADAVDDTPILGWLPANATIGIPERHLGLLTSFEATVPGLVESIGNFFESHFNVQSFLDRLPELEPARVGSVIPASPAKGSGRVRVALAQDAAFAFYYQANRLELERAGAEILNFSPLSDREMPQADFLYLGGGYPEIYRFELEANQSMRRSISRFIESGKPFYAECGGLMYLAKAIDSAAMVGVLPTEIRMTDRLVDFGYCEIQTNCGSLLGPAGTTARGQQFHYSRCTDPALNPLYTVRQGAREYGEGFQVCNGVASYVHLHFLSNPALASTMLKS